MAAVSMRQMLEAGVHFGHQTRYWNPKMASYCSVPVTKSILSIWNKRFLCLMTHELFGTNDRQ
jgi:hypothetical protein